jgi:hypothetical protein
MAGLVTRKAFPFAKLTVATMANNDTCSQKCLNTVEIVPGCLYNPIGFILAEPAVYKNRGTNTENTTQLLQSSLTTGDPIKVRPSLSERIPLKNKLNTHGKDSVFQVHATPVTKTFTF